MSAVAEPTVYIVDDEGPIRELLAWLMKRHGIRCESFPDARSFLNACRPDSPGCVVLDLNMPGMNGLEVQRALKAQGMEMPVIFLSGQADVRHAVQAVKDGAVDFVEKPFDYKRVLALIQDCLARDATNRQERDRRRGLASRIAQLTQREREVMERVVVGKLNRVIAEELAISIKTVEAHRSHIMEKLGVDSLAGLVQAVTSSRD